MHLIFFCQLVFSMVCCIVFPCAIRRSSIPFHLLNRPQLTSDHRPQLTSLWSYFWENTKRKMISNKENKFELLHPKIKTILYSHDSFFPLNSLIVLSCTAVPLPHLTRLIHYLQNSQHIHFPDLFQPHLHTSVLFNFCFPSWYYPKTWTIFLQPMVTKLIHSLHSIRCSLVSFDTLEGVKTYLHWTWNK